MDGDNIYLIVIIVLVAVIIGWQILRARKADKFSDKFGEDILHSLGSLNIEARAISKQEAALEHGSKIQQFRNQRNVRAWIKISSREVELVEIALETIYRGRSQRSTYYTDYVFHTSDLSGSRKLKTTFMKHHEGAPASGDILSLNWDVERGGDKALMESLNQNHKLTEMMLKNRGNALLIPLAIVPEPKNGIAIIRTPQVLPTREQFEAIEAIAKHVKAVW